MATELQPEEEQQFQSWIRGLPWHSEFVAKYGEEPDLNTPVYDYRGAWKAGVVPERNKYDGNMYHWSSQFKSADHPTMWMERFMQATGVDPQSLGLNDEGSAMEFLDSEDYRRFRSVGGGR